MLKLKGWGLRPWLEFTVDPADWRYSKRRLLTEAASPIGYAGIAQELKVSGQGTMLCAVFVHAEDIILLIGAQAYRLFGSGLTKGRAPSRYVLIPPSDHDAQ